MRQETKKVYDHEGEVEKAY